MKAFMPKAIVGFMLYLVTLMVCHAEDPISTNELVKEVSGKLMSGDQQKIDEAVGKIRQLFIKDPRLAAAALGSRWSTPLFFAKRYDDIANFTQNGLMVLQISPSETLLQMRIRALISAGRGDEALSAAKSLYNVASMKSTSVAIDLVVKALVAAHQDQPGIGKKFRLQQMESATTNSLPDSVNKTPSLLADVKVDAKPYEPVIEQLLNADNITLLQLQMLGNYYLISDKPQKAEEVFHRIYDMSDQASLPIAIEGIARSFRAEDGNIARANAYIIAQRSQM